jgi:hypothetical protein
MRLSTPQYALTVLKQNAEKKLIDGHQKKCSYLAYLGIDLLSFPSDGLTCELDSVKALKCPSPAASAYRHAPGLLCATSKSTFQIIRNPL